MLCCYYHPLIIAIGLIFVKTVKIIYTFLRYHGLHIYEWSPCQPMCLGSSRGVRSRSICSGKYFPDTITCFPTIFCRTTVITYLIITSYGYYRNIININSKIFSTFLKVCKEHTFFTVLWFTLLC